ncbi:MAG: hypothetical protein A2W61_04315 [Deltaproteobacteria bacterium RIFCSPLOWO2_01_44_7]|nr:MAG: hypothetical protein A2712_03450 [Deltaproteobacteria bacterium RIFCSPHIGHO2_01_FULL_43_49]OGQ16248.1 MAG: hypothetical protein A3D22_01420 [Deltaproteobacteria bacterium RIFCSPHIGHO2_02_FULL_44_53]OGQ29208.1 MAG: hypothetical protein A3D98_05205 [Deltaproteobacteria bacterium RIFCSPHIGHO2_12_FULL_44_21]OGQ32765.1 MAG: hypothetical protein A2979_09350 [Deltaproteobacteria bacterium RIFCSPLOWO2_01_FULL_45_74]OGQ41867.1 MAG: hypothetical protein A3I70_09135 [Deltaproteobacteria bacterium 
MKKNLRKKKKQTEQDIHEWLEKTDLRGVKAKFRRQVFKNVKPTDWDGLYDEMQESRPISLRLPVYFIHRLKQRALEKGIAYQTLIRLWIGEKLKKAG